MNVTCKDRICTDALFCWCTCRNLDFCFEASQGLSQNPHKNKGVPAFLSHAMGTCLNLKYFHAMLVVWNHYRQSTVISYLWSFYCPCRFDLWAFYCEFHVCSPWLTDSAIIHCNLWEWGHLGFYWGEGVSSYLSSLSPSSCLQAADTVQILCAWHGKHHQGAQGAISCKKLR